MRVKKPTGTMTEFMAYMRSGDAQTQRLKPGKRTAFWKRFKAKKKAAK